MSKKYFQILIGVLVLLVAALLLFDRAEENSVTRDSKALLSGINSDQISKVVIEQGKGKVEIAQFGDNWNVTQRSGYPADLNKLRSLLLKLVDLNVSQKVTTNPTNFERLGVADNSFQKETERSPGKVSLLDSSSKELGVVFLGDRKKKSGKKEEMLDDTVGQFIRKAGSNEVYLVAEPIDVNAAPESMIATDLLSIPSARVKRVLQEKINGASKEKQFEMLSVKEADGKIRFDLDLEPNIKQEIQNTVVDSIAAGLENVRIQDVQKDSGIKFDQVTSYELSTGAVYQVETVIKDGKAFAKYNVSFNQTLADNTISETENQNQKRKAEYDQKKKEAEEKKEAAPPVFTPAKADVVTQEDTARENTKLSGWVFEFPTYQIEKYRKGETDLIKEKVENEGAAPPVSPAT